MATNSSVYLCFFLALLIVKFSHSYSRHEFDVISTTAPSISCENQVLELTSNITKLEQHIANLQKQLERKSDLTPPRHCKEVQDRGNNVSNVYFIQPRFAPKPFAVFCDMNTRGGGWIYLLNRIDGSQNFFLNWESYKNGFGDLNREFFLGLEKIHLLTGYDDIEMLVELNAWDGGDGYAHYETFSVGNEDEGYALKILNGYTGTTGDALHVAVGMKWTTKDKDQDLWLQGNCAVWSDAAWWYRSCKSCQLTGIIRPKNYGEDRTYKSLVWDGFRPGYISLKAAKMMIRPRGRRIRD